MKTTAAALVLVPGLMCDDTVWCAARTALAQCLPVQVVDHGMADSLPAMAAQLLEGAPPRFAIAGHSMGGRVALEVLRQAPQDDAAGAREREVRAGFLRLANEQGVAAMARYWVRGMLHPDRLGDVALVEEIVQMFARKPVAVFAAQISALLNRPEAGPLLPQIRVPTLVLSGDRDANSPPAANQEMAAAISGAQLVLLQHCGHMAPQEHPVGVTAALTDWLQR
jgi:pimeloyl-ACP methyl ester carboxylesterase